MSAIPHPILDTVTHGFYYDNSGSIYFRTKDGYGEYILNLPIGSKGSKTAEAMNAACNAVLHLANT